MKSVYTHKIPSLPYNKRGKQNAKCPNKKKQQINHGCRSDPAKRPEPFEGVKERQREPERQHYPFLTIHIDFMGQMETIRNGGNIIVSVTNNGNGTAYTSFVELIESSHNGLFVDPSDPGLFHRRGYLMLPVLYPHQTRTVQVDWSRHFISGRIVGICYDPLLDPRPEVPYRPWNLPLFHQKITSIHWSGWQFWPRPYLEFDGNMGFKR